MRWYKSCCICRLDGLEVSALVPCLLCFQSSDSVDEDSGCRKLVLGEVSWSNHTQKRLKNTLADFDTDTQYVHFLRNPLCEAINRHLNNR